MKAAVSIDVDTLNDYAYTYQKNYHKYPDPIYTIAIPRLLKLLDAHKIKATFFIIGRDLKIKNHLEVIRKIYKAGHEIANHTQNHIHDFEKLSYFKQKSEILTCHRLAESKLRVTMKGFRAPGYNLNKGTFEVLAQNDYSYDSSLFPTSFLPFLKLAIAAKSGRRHKSTGGGEIKNMFGKVTPHFVTNNLVEVPVSVTPILRLPFMGTFSIVTGRKFLELSLEELFLFKRSVNYEIHPIELLSFKEDKLPIMIRDHPGITIPLARKENIYNTLISKLKQKYKVVKLISIAQDFQ